MDYYTATWEPVLQQLKAQIVFTVTGSLAIGSLSTYLVKRNRRIGQSIQTTVLGHCSGLSRPFQKDASSIHTEVWITCGPKLLKIHRIVCAMMTPTSTVSSKNLLNKYVFANRKKPLTNLRYLPIYMALLRSNKLLENIIFACGLDKQTDKKQWSYKVYFFLLNHKTTIWNVIL